MPTDDRSESCKLCGQAKDPEDVPPLYDGGPRVCRDCLAEIKRKHPSIFTPMPNYPIELASLDRRKWTGDSEALVTVPHTLRPLLQWPASSCALGWWAIDSGPRLSLAGHP